jgi:AraC family transcriptional regulator, transcriptional activator of pobA
MPGSKPLKIPLFRLASGRQQVDDRLGISFQQLALEVPFRHVPHRHDFYHIVWIESGQGTFVGDARSHPVGPGTLIFVPPGRVHTWNWSEPVEGYVLSFEPALFFGRLDPPERLLHDLTQWSISQGPGQLNGTLRETLGKKLEELVEEFCNNQEFRAEMLRVQVAALLIWVRRFCVGRESDQVGEQFGPLTSRFLALLELSEGKLQRTEHYLSALSVSSRTLAKVVLAETGKSPSTWIRDRTLIEARRLLSYTDLTISEIAYRLNFRNVSYFVRFYRRLTGMSPGTARRM